MNDEGLLQGFDVEPAELSRGGGINLSPSSGVEEDLGVHEERNSGVVCGNVMCQTEQPGGKLWSIASWCQFVPVAKPDFNCSDSCIGGEVDLEKGRARPRRRV